MKKRGRYRHHPSAFKRALVEASLQPEASVARLACEHGINANQLFAWRKAYREGRLEQPTFLPVTVTSHPDTPKRLACTRAMPEAGRTTLEQGGVRLSIEGRPDLDVLRLVLMALPR